MEQVRLTEDEDKDEMSKQLADSDKNSLLSIQTKNKNNTLRSQINLIQL